MSVELRDASTPTCGGYGDPQLAHYFERLGGGRGTASKALCGFPIERLPAPGDYPLCVVCIAEAQRQNKRASA